MNSFYSLLVLVSIIIAPQVHGEYTIQEESNSTVTCGGNLTSERGAFQSPKHPKLYRPNTECTWKITVPLNYHVALKFQSFALEGGDGCNYDYLEIRDGHEYSSPVLGKVCGDKIPEDIVSSSNKMTVTFVSDSTAQNTGFSAEFIQDGDDCEGDNGCEHRCIDTFGSYRCECRIGFELHTDGRKCVESCGGVIEEANGIITSPSFPDPYPPSKTCIWEIVAPTQHKITLNFTYFDLEEDECNYDIVRIQSIEPDNEIVRHGTFCGSYLPHRIISASNILRIEFSSDTSEQKSGFSAFFVTEKDECMINNGDCEHNCENVNGTHECSCYGGYVLQEDLHNCTKVICGGNVSSDEGIFTSPNYPEAYWPHEECIWEITVQENYQVALMIESFKLESSSACDLDYLEVRDGHESFSPVLGKFCSDSIPELILSSSNKMAVKFVTDGSVQHSGFAAVYSKTLDECKGDHGCEHECKNTIGGYKCECRHGFDLQSDGRSCVAICGGDVSSEKGILHSPDYPEHYRPNIDCTWNITVPENHQIALKFQSFELESDYECENDYLEIRDGHESSSPMLGRFCGEQIPEDLFSSSNKIAVTFASDQSSEKAGFSAEFIADVDECKGGDHGCEQECINTFGGYRCACRIGFDLHIDGRTCVVGCGGLFEQDNGIITSPSFPHDYPPNQNCTWEIIAPPDHRIVLNFINLDLEGGNEVCVFDRIDIANKMPEGEFRKHDSFCGSKLPPATLSKGNHLRIVFSSDATMEKSGFRALFFADKDECATNNGGCEDDCEKIIGGYNCSCSDPFVLHENRHNCTKTICGGELSSVKGILLSPNYPQYYDNEMECTWKITVPEKHQVVLKFQNFELESSQECKYDYLEIRDGHESTSPVLGKFCGSNIPADIYSSSNKMAAKFVSDSSSRGFGFAAGFSQNPDECKGCKEESSNTLEDVLLRVKNHLRDVIRRKQV